MSFRVVLVLAQQCGQGLFVVRQAAEGRHRQIHLQGSPHHMLRPTMMEGFVAQYRRWKVVG